jgi:hypothetical protein
LLTGKPVIKEKQDNRQVVILLLNIKSVFSISSEGIRSRATAAERDHRLETKKSDVAMDSIRIVMVQ